MLAGGKPLVLLHVSEFVVIGGVAAGVLIIASPAHVLKEIVHKVKSSIAEKSAGKSEFFELLKLLYELFMMGRRNGLIALEEHVMDPENSALFKKYPSVLNHHERLQFLCNGLKPVIDGKIKPDQLRLLLDAEINRLEIEHHAPVSVLQKTGDSMPGFGIVAAVLGIVITMASIGGAVEDIGTHVAAALVGTFLGILLAYGFMGPLATNLEFVSESELDFTRCIAACVTGFANGMAPVTAVELGRRGLSREYRPSAEELEQMFKAMKSGK